MIEEKDLKKMTVRELEKIEARLNLKSIQPKMNDIPFDISGKSIEYIAFVLSIKKILKWRLISATPLGKGGKEYFFESFFQKEINLKAIKKFDKYGSYTYEYWVNNVKFKYYKPDLLVYIIQSSDQLKIIDEEKAIIYNKAQLLIHHYKTMGGVSAIYLGGGCSPR